MKDRLPPLGYAVTALVVLAVAVIWFVRGEVLGGLLLLVAASGLPFAGLARDRLRTARQLLEQEQTPKRVAAVNRANLISGSLGLCCLAAFAAGLYLPTMGA